METLTVGTRSLITSAILARETIVMMITAAVGPVIAIIPVVIRIETGMASARCRLKTGATTIRDREQRMGR
jgi:hypothetical protein